MTMKAGFDKIKTLQGKLTCDTIMARTINKTIVATFDDIIIALFMTSPMPPICCLTEELLSAD